VLNTAVFIVLGIDLEGQRDVLGHWVGDGAEGANFWLSVVTDLQTRGVSDIFLACVDGLTGFKAAIQAVFPKTHIQRCIIHQVRHSLTYVTWKDRKVFARDLRAIYQAPTREAAETELLKLSEKWGATYAVAVRSWESNWEDLATMFDYGAEIRRLIYTTNTIEGYNRQLRKVTKTKGAFPTAEAARKLRFLVTRDITRKWTMPPQNWACILIQVFDGCPFVGVFLVTGIQRAIGIAVFIVEYLLAACPPSILVQVDRTAAAMRPIIRYSFPHIDHTTMLPRISFT
jgi:transposase-like protein